MNAAILEDRYRSAVARGAGMVVVASAADDYIAALVEAQYHVCGARVSAGVFCGLGLGHACEHRPTQ